MVYYNTVSMKFIFTASYSFSFIFTQAEQYDGAPFYPQYSQWGLGSYLGFDKQVYTSSFNSTYRMFVDGFTINDAQIIDTPHTASVFGDSHIYMEIEQYNSMDEIAPYTFKSSNEVNAKYNGKHNSAFAKIPLVALSNEKMYISKESFLFNTFYSEPPLERIQKLKFKFRFHDGRPVDFGTTNFSFTLFFKLSKEYLK
jgi:hypothetical protein